MEIKREFSEKALQDFKLIDQATNEGDESAYAMLMDRYKRPVYHMILKMVRNVDDQQDVKVVYVGQNARAKLPTIEVGDTVSAVGKWSKGILVASTLKRSRPRKKRIKD